MTRTDDPSAPSHLRLAASQSVADVCLDEATLLDLLRGDVDAAARASIEAHVDGCPSCRRAIAVLALSSPAPGESIEGPFAPTGLVSSPAPAARPLTEGTMVEHFRVLRPLGHGGMGDVYLAEDTQLERWVALKIIRSAHAPSPEAVARMLDEARTTARFNHQNIVTIHHVGTHESQPYLALEYLDGQTLRQRMAGGPLEVAELVYIARAIALALLEAQRHGVLHRDLKPENVMLPSDAQPRVLDFGLAAEARSSAAVAEAASTLDAHIDAATDARVAESMVSHHRALQGTPAYMAPEQWRGDPCSEASDVWALGVMLFEAITGRRPFGETSMTALRERVIDAQTASTLAPYATVLPESLRDLCEACLSKDPADRPSVRAVVDVLHALHEQNSERNAELAKPHGRALGTLMTIGGAIIGLVGLTVASGSIGVWIEEGLGGASGILVFLAFGITPVAGAIALSWLGLRRPTSSVALLILAAVLVSVGAVFTLTQLDSMLNGGTDPFGYELLLLITHAAVPLGYTALLITRAVRDIIARRSSASAALGASAAPAIDTPSRERVAGPTLRGPTHRPALTVNP